MKENEMSFFDIAKGFEEEGNYEDAEYYYQLGILENEPCCMVNLGTLYLTKFNNPKAAFVLFAASTEPEGYWNAGQMLIAGHGVREKKELGEQLMEEYGDQIADDACVNEVIVE